MKRLSLLVGLLGMLHLTFWLWAPWIAQWQTTNLLKRYNSMESFDVAMGVFNESMHAPFIVAAALGALMLLASYLLYRSHPAGWLVWLASLAIGFTAAVHVIVQNGPSGGNLLRVAFLLGIAYVTYRIKRQPEVAISSQL
jgi:hypothetical protein